MSKQRSLKAIDKTRIKVAVHQEIAAKFAPDMAVFKAHFEDWYVHAETQIEKDRFERVWYAIEAVFAAANKEHSGYTAAAIDMAQEARYQRDLVLEVVNQIRVQDPLVAGLIEDLIILKLGGDAKAG